MKKRPFAIAAAILVSATVLSACGGSSKPTLDQIKSDGVISFGTEGTYSPFSYHDPKTKKLTGYDVEVSRAVAKKLGVKAKFVETNFDSIFAGLTADRYDAVGNQVTITPERQKLYSFSEPYTVSTGVIIVKANNTSITSLADLKGKTTAQSATTTFAKLAKDAGAKVQAVEGFAQEIALVKQGRVDAVINDKLAALQYLATTGDTGVKISGTAGDKTEQAFALRKKDSAVAKAINKALDELRADGTLAKISAKYFKEDVSK